jgi:hypothetical protein
LEGHIRQVWPYFNEPLEGHIRQVWPYFNDLWKVI